MVSAGTADITVTFDSTGLEPGIYYANIVISSNDPDEDPVVVPVTLGVDVAGLSGTILLQGRPAGDHDGTTVLFVGPEIAATETDQNGNFSAVLTPGTYTVTAAHRNYLSAQTVVDVILPVGGSVGTSEDEPGLFALLLVGDLNGDGVINTYDLPLLASNLSESESQFQLQP